MYVDGDPVRLSQILSNLLNNASKFTPRGGHVELSTRLDGETVEITVTDDGIGFSEDDGHRIFELFVQLDASKSQSTSGLGVGLTIVRSLVEMHGGRIEARSSGPGNGAVFAVRLPVASTPHPVSVPPARDVGSNVGKRRVLVVDDNVDAADSLAHMLRLQTYEVETLYDGAEALAAARTFRPDVAFIDLNMPGMGGIELARALRAEPWAAALRLIAVTGRAQKADVDSTRSAGFHAHLVKPAQPEEIVALASGGTDNVVPLRGTDRSAG
jgi:CheY-like chemotaxis protein